MSTFNLQGEPKASGASSAVGWLVGWLEIRCFAIFLIQNKIIIFNP